MMIKAVILLLATVSVQSYNVAVVEFLLNTNYSQTAAERVESNTLSFIQLIDETKSANGELDMIVFPESGLESSTRTAPILPTTSNVVLCNSTDDTYLSFLKNISCAAIEYNVVIVINLTEQDSCEIGETDCPDSQIVYYNTNVAFATNGSVVARYRKYNLFGEIGKNKPTVVDVPVFEAGGARFGMMTCFDIQFGIPSMNLTIDKGLDNIIFPTHWFSELPYLTALQTQQMYAQENNVTLLAAGASLSRTGSGGSGIFLGSQGPLDMVMEPYGGTKVLYGQVPQTIVEPHINNLTSIDEMAEMMDGFYLIVDPSLIDHTSEVVNVSINSTNTTVCNGDGSYRICCNFQISISTQDIDQDKLFYTYQMVAFNGVRSYSGLYYGGVETCGLLACLNASITSCGQRFSNYSQVGWPITIDKAIISANFSVNETRIQYPTTLHSSIHPLSVQDYTWESSTDGNEIVRTLTLVEPQKRLLTFGIFGRHYERDWDPIRNSTSSSTEASTSVESNTSSGDSTTSSISYTADGTGITSSAARTAELSFLVAFVMIFIKELRKY